MLKVSSLSVEVAGRALVTDASFMVGRRREGRAGRAQRRRQDLAALGAARASRAPAHPPRRGRPHGHVHPPAPGARQPGARRRADRARPTCCPLAGSTGSTPRCTRRARRWPRTRRRLASRRSATSRRRSPHAAATRPRARWPGSPRGSGSKRSSSWRTSPRSRGASDAGSTSCACSTRARGRWSSTSPRTTSTAQPSAGCSASSRRCPARSCSSATTSPLLDEAIDKVLHLTDGTVTEYKGNYTAFLRQSAEARARSEVLAKREDQEIRRLKAFADARRHSTEKQARKAKIADRKVERLEATRTKVAAKGARLDVPAARPAAQRRRRARASRAARRLRTSRRALEDLAARRARATASWSSGATVRASRACCAAWRACRSRPPATLRYGANVELGYFAQEHEQLDESRTALAHLEDSPLADRGRAAQAARRLRAHGRDRAAPARRAVRRGARQARLGPLGRGPGRTSSCSTSRRTTWTPRASSRSRGCWSAGRVPSSRSATSARSPRRSTPTHAVLLPEEHVDLWREEYLDLVEQR